VVWNVSNYPWLYLYCGPGAEGGEPLKDARSSSRKSDFKIVEVEKNK